tara:strand:- start:608 stop:1177 length:570 start_codon:yes stop_codon:yes gene_type:complete
MDNSKKPYHKYKPKRYSYIDNEGNSLSAAGILPYDAKGIWVIGEKGKNVILYTDMGGRYDYHDCDIYQTISREFNEELYHSVEITRSQMEELYPKSKRIYIKGPKGDIVYVSVLVHVDTLAKLGIHLSPESFSNCRDKVVKANPSVPDKLYESVELKYLTYPEIEVLLKQNRVSTRLRKILAQFNQNYE